MTAGELFRLVYSAFKILFHTVTVAGCFFVCRIKLFFSIFFLFICFFAGCGIYFFERESVDFSKLEYFSESKPSVVLDSSGNEITRFQADKRKFVSFDKFPDILIKGNRESVGCKDAA